MHTFIGSLEDDLLPAGEPFLGGGAAPPGGRDHDRLPPFLPPFFPPPLPPFWPSLLPLPLPPPFLLLPLSLPLPPRPRPLPLPLNEPMPRNSSGWRQEQLFLLGHRPVFRQSRQIPTVFPASLVLAANPRLAGGDDWHRHWAETSSRRFCCKYRLASV